MMSVYSSSSSSQSDDADTAFTPATTPSPPPELSSPIQRRKLRAVLMRAGSSKGLFVHLSDLPSDRSQWGPILCAALGSPDPFCKQLNGVGGGVSTQSKVAIISPSADPRADVDYLFAQVPVDGTELDFTGNCGNMASGVGPFAVEEGLYKVEGSELQEVTVRIRNVNTDRFVHSTFPTYGQIPVEDGELRLDGVSGSAAPLRLDFMDPAGSMTGRLLPTGSPIDSIELPDGRVVTVSCIDAANPFVFVPYDQVGLDHTATNADIAKPSIVSDLMQIRALAAVKMGLAVDTIEAARRMGTPKIALVAPSPDLANDILIRAFSMGKPHPTIQMTGAVCVGAASAVPGSVVNMIVSGKEAVVIGHAGGSMVVTGQADCSGDFPKIISGSVYRTARRLMEGNVIL